MVIPEKPREGNTGFLNHHQQRNRCEFLTINEPVLQLFGVIEETFFSIQCLLQRLNASIQDRIREREYKASTINTNRNPSKTLKKTLLIFMVMVSLAECYCPESSDTVEFVKDCPMNKTEWERRAEKKKCSSIPQRCSEHSEFRYHCVLNSHADQLMEVCAPSVFVSEYCCEYNQKGAIIQRNYDAECMNFRKPCNTSYFSYESYKYPECYEIVLKNQKSSKSSSVSLNPSKEPTTLANNVVWNHSTKESEISTTEVSGWVIVIVIFSGVILVLATFSMLYCLYMSKGRITRQNLLRAILCLFVCKEEKFDRRKNTDPEENDVEEAMIERKKLALIEVK